ncbi:DNA-binding Xre family transcriptional regulator/PAS domain-containing protein [Paenibacillus phyllosphaerae]|uniref:DNA-binding Xre family transcriptional regulator/PAS domain-containing protein n=1 Tax=Paenibacillus phyllosphaerae TaxID=274593 RepID=A0A7W5B138_9BACL|nr:helix-turn-helix transcriptional regulator [Paenibacillus phyllosphaerae]MBB3112194.1 DNA-binding Xre family transcriptional regulator/PAS domain-containing protein [Paenibacillus phyllosphaerae]
MPVFETIFQTLDTPMALLQGSPDQPFFDRTNDAFVRLTGYSEAELAKLKLYTLFTDWSESSLSEEKALHALRPKHSQPIQVKLTCKRLETHPVPVWLLTAEDVSAALWIEEQLRTQTVLISGIVDANFMIDRIDKKYPMSVFDPGIDSIDQSVMGIVHEDEQERAMEAVKRAVLGRKPESLTIRTKRLADTLDLEVNLIFAPFYHGDSSLKQYAFVVTDLRPSSEQADPSVKLKILMARCNIAAQDLSESTGISVQTISKLRNGKIRKPQRLTAELIANELGVKPNDIWD